MTNSRSATTRWWRRRWWRRRSAKTIFAGVAIILMLVLFGPTAARPFVRAKLRAMIREQLNADLEIGSLAYVFPYGVSVTDARLVARDTDGRPVDLVSAKRLAISLAKLPIRPGPLVIRSVEIDSPAVHLILTPSGIVGDGLTSKPDLPALLRRQKLSQMFELQRLALNDGLIVYEDRTAAGSLPLVWRGLQIDLKTDARTSGAASTQPIAHYAFDLAAGAGGAASLSVAGSLSIDDLVVHLNRCGLNVRVDPNKTDDSPIPAALQPLLRDNQISGELAIDVTGDLPIAEPNRANLTATIDLPRASGRLPGADARLDELSMKLTARAGQMNDASVLKVDIDRFVARGGGFSARIDGGSVAVNATAGSWGISGLTIAVAPGVDLSSLPPAIRDLLTRTKVSGGAIVAIDGSGPIGSIGTASGGAGGDSVGSDKVGGDNVGGDSVAGGGASGAAATTNLAEPMKLVDATIRISPQDLSIDVPGLPLPLRDFADAEIRIADGVATIRNLRAGYGDDVVLLSRAAVRIEDLLRGGTIACRDVAGCLTLARQPGRYPPPLDQYIAQVQPRGPFWFAGEASVDLTRPDLEPDYRIRITTDRGAISTRVHHIPLLNVNADVTVTPTAVKIDRFDADVLSGKLRTSGRIEDLRGDMRYDMKIRAQGIDLNMLAQLTVDPGEKPITVSGELDAEIAASGSGVEPPAALDRLRADGAVRVLRGDLLRVPVLDGIADAVGRSKLATVGDAGCTFKLVDRTITLTDAAVGSPALGVRGNGTIALDGRLALDVIATPLSKWDRQIRGERERSGAVRDFVASVAGGVQNGLDTVTEKFLYRLRVSGTVEKPDVGVIAGATLQK